MKNKISKAITGTVTLLIATVLIATMSINAFAVSVQTTATLRINESDAVDAPLTTIVEPNPKDSPISNDQLLQKTPSAPKTLYFFHSPKNYPQNPKVPDYFSIWLKNSSFIR